MRNDPITPAEKDGVRSSASSDEKSYAQEAEQELAPPLAQAKPIAVLFRQLAKPSQRDRGLRIVDFVTTVERADFNPLKSGAFE